MHIRAYLKPTCGWSRGVRAVFKKYGLEYEDLDIINNRALYAEMVQKSGQPLSPCVEIDGKMLADISGEEVEQYMLANKLVQPTDVAAEAPTNASCTDAEHAQQAAAAASSSKAIRFF
jgi:monothiol glutaredoxin